MHWQLSSGWQQMSSAAQQLLDRIIDTRNCIQLKESARIHSLRPNRTALIICQWQTKDSVILGQLGSPLWVVIFGRIPTRVTLDEVRKGAGWCVSGNGHGHGHGGRDITHTHWWRQVLGSPQAVGHFMHSRAADRQPSQFMAGNLYLWGGW